jgi:hypothetical protein
MGIEDLRDQHSEVRNEQEADKGLKREHFEQVAFENTIDTFMDLSH